MPPDDRTGDPELGRRLRILREALGLEQWEVGARLNPQLDQRTISSYETGSRDPSTAVIKQLTKVLETTTAFLYGETDNPLNVPGRIRQIGLDPGNVASLSEEAQLLVVQMIEQLRARSLSPPPEGSGQGEPDVSGDESTTASAG